MKSNISLENDKIKLKWKGKKIIIPHDHIKEKPWDEHDD